jgi:hypothetical protein
MYYYGILQLCGKVNIKIYELFWSHHIMYMLYSYAQQDTLINNAT